MRPGPSTFVALIVATLLTGCAASDGPRTSGELRRHAATAGQVMTRGHAAVPANDAAYEVVGQRDGTTITAVKVAGTTFAGEVVLRIQVSDGAGTISGGTSTACFRYVFRHRLDDATPHRLACPPGPPVAVTAPPPPAPVTAATVALVRRVLASLTPAERQDPDAVRTALRNRLGSRYTVVAGRDGGAISVQVLSGDQCVNGRLGAGGDLWLSTPARGTDCEGG